MRGGAAARGVLKWGGRGMKGRRWVIYKGWDFWYNGR